jgi:D-alanyl-D-alanine dipeptidase
MNKKILQRVLKRLGFLVFFTVIFYLLRAQQLPLSAYGLPYINDVALFRESLINHPEKQMNSLTDIPGISLDLRYASSNNFMHKKLYPANIKTSFLRNPVFDALINVSRELGRMGIGLVIFDAYRPYRTTVELWIPVKDERYAANPAKGSGHNRGIAVDLTLADLKTHRQLLMPTGFDNFSDSAHQDFRGTDSIRIANRELLKRVMVKHGFIPLPTEWWHFSWPDPEHFEVLDLSFAELAK